MELNIGDDDADGYSEAVADAAIGCSARAVGSRISSAVSFGGVEDG
jgi:hypothetical protein